MTVRQCVAACVCGATTVIKVDRAVLRRWSLAVKCNEGDVSINYCLKTFAVRSFGVVAHENDAIYVALIICCKIITHTIGLNSIAAKRKAVTAFVCFLEHAFYGSTIA